MCGTGGSSGVRSSSASISSAGSADFAMIVIGTGTQRHYHRSKTVDVSNDNNSQFWLDDGAAA